MLSLPKKMTALTETYNPTSMSLCRARVSIIGESEPTNEQSGNELCVLTSYFYSSWYRSYSIVKKKKKKANYSVEKLVDAFLLFKIHFNDVKQSRHDFFKNSVKKKKKKKKVSAQTRIELDPRIHARIAYKSLEEKVYWGEEEEIAGRGLLGGARGEREKEGEERNAT